VALMTVVIGFFLLRASKHIDIGEASGVEERA
jgi:hypothetical protein